MNYYINLSTFLHQENGKKDGKEKNKKVFAYAFFFCRTTTATRATMITRATTIKAMFL